MTLFARRLCLLMPALVLLVACRTSAQANPSGPNKASGTLLQITSTPAHSSQGESWLYLKTDGGDTYRLSFCSEVSVEDIAPHMRVTVSYSRLEAGVMYSCQPPRQEGSARRRMLGNTIDAPTRPTFLVYVVTMCGYDEPAVTTPQAMFDFMVGNGTNNGKDNGNRKRNMADYYDTCSYGQAQISPSQIKVLGPYNIPCSGDVVLPFTFPSGNDFDTKNCNNDNPLKWHYYLDSLARKDKVTPTDYHHKIMVYPKGFTGKKEGCNGVAGAGSVGPWLQDKTGGNTWGTGVVWLSGDFVTSLEILFHELGHNMGLAHASIPGGCDLRDQCDHLCAMGARGGQGIRCFNPPHLWQLGWGQPSQELTGQSLRVGATQLLNLKPQWKSPDNYVTVSLPGMRDNQKLYIAARTNKYDYDLPYTADKDGRGFVTVHSYDGVLNNAYRTTFTMADVARDQTYFHPPSGLVVYFMNWDPAQGATVAFCVRRGDKESSCGDNLDDDCDFLPDHLDPDCVNANSLSKPPTPLRRPPPSSPPPLKPSPPPGKSSQPPPRSPPPSPSRPPRSPPSPSPPPHSPPPSLSPPRSPPPSPSPPLRSPPPRARPPPRSPPVRVSSPPPLRRSLPSGPPPSLRPGAKSPPPARSQSPPPANTLSLVGLRSRSARRMRM